MITNIEKLKGKMKDEYAKKVDKYFSQYEEMKKNGNFDINGIEKLLGNGINDAKEVVMATSEEMIKQEIKAENSTESNADGKKKRAPFVKKQ